MPSSSLDGRPAPAHHHERPRTALRHRAAWTPMTDDRRKPGPLRPAARRGQDARAELRVHEATKAACPRRHQTPQAHAASAWIERALGRASEAERRANRKGDRDEQICITAARRQMWLRLTPTAPRLMPRRPARKRADAKAAVAGYARRRGSSPPAPIGRRSSHRRPAWTGWSWFRRAGHGWHVPERQRFGVS